MSRKKRVRNLVGLLQGLAINVCFALSFVVSIVSLLVLLVTVYSAGPSSTQLPCTVSMDNDVTELKNNAVVMFVVIMLMFQCVVFRCATSKHFPPARIRLTSRKIKNLLRKRLMLLSTSFRLYRLRNIVHMLLLLSGDVELNPGPTGKKSGADYDREQEESADSGFRTEQSDSANPSCDGHNPSDQEHESSIVLVPTPPRLPGTVRPFSLEEFVDEFPSVSTATKPKLVAQRSHSFPQSNQEMAHRYMNDMQKYVCEFIKKIDALEIELVETQKVNDGTTHTINNLRDTVAKLEQEVAQLRAKIPVQVEFSNYPTLNTDDRDLESLYHDLWECVKTCLKRETYNCHSVDNYRSYLCDLFKKFCSWRKKQTILTKEGYRMFFLIINQLYRLRPVNLCLLCNSEECKTPCPLYKIEHFVSICPLCYSEKHTKRRRGNETDPKSHLWPAALFRSYKSIHQPDGSSDFSFLDTSTNTPRKIRIDNISIRMFCDECEGATGDIEEKLLHMYNFLMARPDVDVEFRNENSWFHKVLAVTMFRGALVNCNLIKELHQKNYSFFEALDDLLTFCTTPNHQLPPSRDIFVFMLPHDSYMPDFDLMHAFEIQLRNPEFTCVTKLQTEDFSGTFLYMQFDCIHCVYPLCDVSYKYFHDHCPDNYSSSVGAETVVFPSSSARKYLFPKALLDINFSRAEQLMLYLAQNKTSTLYAHSIAFLRIGPSLEPNYQRGIPKYVESFSPGEPRKITYEREVIAKIKDSSGGECDGETKLSFCEKCEDKKAKVPFHTKVEGLGSFCQQCVATAKQSLNTECQDKAKGHSILRIMNVRKIDPDKAEAYCCAALKVRGFRASHRAIEKKIKRAENEMEQLKKESDERKQPLASLATSEETLTDVREKAKMMDNDITKVEQAVKDYVQDSTAEDTKTQDVSNTNPVSSRPTLTKEGMVEQTKDKLHSKENLTGVMDLPPGKYYISYGFI